MMRNLKIPGFGILVAITSLSVLLAPRHADAAELVINGAVVRGIDEVFRADTSHGRGHKLDYYKRMTSEDGLNQVMFELPDESTLWIAFGRHMLLYADTTSRVKSASYGGKPAHVLHIDDENDALDSRPPVGMRMVSILLLMVVAGLVAGIISGVVARRNLAVLGRNPLLDHSFYGFIIGILIALLAYGLSERRFDVDGLFASYTEDHLNQFRQFPLDPK